VEAYVAKPEFVGRRFSCAMLSSRISVPGKSEPTRGRKSGPAAWWLGGIKFDMPRCRLRPGGRREEDETEWSKPCEESHGRLPHYKRHPGQVAQCRHRAALPGPLARHPVSPIQTRRPMRTPSPMRNLGQPEPIGPYQYTAGLAVYRPPVCNVAPAVLPPVCLVNMCISCVPHTAPEKCAPVRAAFPAIWNRTPRRKRVFRE